MIDEGRHTKVSFSSVFLHTGSFAQNFFQTIFVVYELNSFWQKEKALNYSAPEWGAIIEE